MIFAKTNGRVPDRANRLRRQVFASAHEIVNLARLRVEHQRVDREIPPQRVFFRIGLELDRIRTPTVRVRVVAAKCRDFDLRAVSPNQHDAKLRPDQFRRRKQRNDLLGPRVGGDVEILRRPLEEQIADAATDKVRLPSTLFESCGDAPGQFF